MASDEKWYKDIQEETLYLTKSDFDKPYIYKKIYKKDDKRYKVNLVFIDKSSWIIWWEILKNWKVIYKFNWNLASFEVDNLNEISYKVEDFYWNESSWKINF